MGIKFDATTNTWSASYAKRHPVTGVPRNLRRRGLASKAEALRVEKDLVLELEKKLNATIVPNWSTFLEEYFLHLQEVDLSKKTVNNTMVCLKAATLEVWGETPIDKIAPKDIRELVKERYADRSPSYQKCILKYVRGAFKYAVQASYTPSNPTPELKFRLGDKNKGVLTEDQLRILLQKAYALKAEWRHIWALAAYTGMRTGELYALAWDQVDLPNRKINVDRSWNNQDGFKDTKSGDDRIVEIAEALVPILEELKRDTGGLGFVLPRIEEWQGGEQARELRYFLTGIGLPPIRFHDLRASWCTILLNKGVEPIKIMRMGGWKDYKTMQKYIRMAGVDVKGVTESLNLTPRPVLQPAAQDRKIVHLLDLGEPVGKGEVLIQNEGGVAEVAASSSKVHAVPIIS